ncbi:MAG: hypothetical protein J2O48_11980 [Solirubrobacterales bacterium]|nr:hypothetical protein [Solirubrobacterales bacterium]
MASVTLAALLAFGLSSAAPALANQASGGITSFNITPVSTDAGSHPDINFGIGFKSGETPKSMSVDLAPGLWASLTSGGGQQVATGTVSATAAGVLPVTGNATMTLDSIPPGASDSALTGMTILVKISSPVQTTIAVKGYWDVDADNGTLRLVVPSLPNTALGGVPITLNSINLKFAGSVNGQPFTRLPTSDQPATSTASATMYTGDSGSGNDSFTPTGSPPFSPSIASTSAKAINNVPNADVNVDVKQPAWQAGTAGMNLIVPGSALPVNIGAVPDLTPQGTQVGTVAVQTPLLPYTLQGTFTVSGSLYDPVATIAFPSLGGLHFSGHIPPHSIASNAEIDFTGIPDFPFTDFSVTLPGGSRGMLNANCPGSGSMTGTFISQWQSRQVPASTPVSLTGCPPNTATGSEPGASKPAAKPGKPTLTKVDLRGLAKRRAQLGFTLNQGRQAPKISSFTVEPPGALSWKRAALKQDLSVAGAKLKGYKLSGRKLTVTLKSAASHPRLRVKAGALSEWRILQIAAKQKIITSLNMNVDAKAGKTSAQIRTRIKRFN